MSNVPSTPDDRLNIRGYYLQKYFPPTIAAMANKLMPNSNIAFNS